MELTQEKSQELALVIEMMKGPIYLIDLEYAKELVKSMHEQAIRQDTLAVLNPMYNSDRSELLHLQADALKNLIDFIDKLKKADEFKKKIGDRDAHYQNMQKLFH